ncbi:MAG TPA: hypothetical protein PK635_08740, partial [Actinomycetota bacterium]|nr:hypothetical protein [Actinomycetota bacterium]
DELLASVSIHDVATAYIRPEARAGAHLSFSCSYEAQPVTVAEVYSGDNSDFAGAQDFALPDMCHAWGVKPRILEFSDPLVGDVPVLVAEGALSESGVNDWGDEVVELIENPLVVRFDTMSSDLAYDPPPCLRELRKEFAVDPGGDRYAAALHALFDLDPAAVTALTQTPEDLSDEPDDVSIHGEPGA